MASDHVLRIPRSDIQGEYVIVSVNSNGPALLDLQLIGTEGTTPYLETGNLVPGRLAIFNG